MQFAKFYCCVGDEVNELVNNVLRNDQTTKFLDVDGDSSLKSPFAADFKVSNHF